ncbi:MAG TPA: SRPBCC family protein [Gaiellaceae bacterium]|nr:SRPBCC family protein [Gaiellaceae bacterium]
MAPIVESIDIARPPEEVFAYIDDLSRHGEWQEQIQQVTVLTDGPTKVGSRARDRRKVPGGEQEITYEITAHDPPRSASFRGVDGPVRPLGTVQVEPSGGGSRVTIELDFQGHGLGGKVLLPLVRSQARKQVPRDQQKLKERLEAGA